MELLECGNKPKSHDMLRKEERRELSLSESDFPRYGLHLFIHSHCLILLARSIYVTIVYTKSILEKMFLKYSCLSLLDSLTYLS